jgi:hypothetical protein
VAFHSRMRPSFPAEESTVLERFRHLAILLDGEAKGQTR